MNDLDGGGFSAPTTVEHVLLVEDHPLFRQAFHLLLVQLCPEVSVVEAPSAEAGLTQHDKTGDFDIIFLDLALPGMSGIEAVRAFRKRYPSSPLIILSAADHPDLVQEALALGAQGYIPKWTDSGAMADAVRNILKGRIEIPESTTFTPIEAAAPSPGEGNWGLSLRQIDVLMLLSEGCPNKDIARRLGMSANTVRTHVAAIFRALGVNTRTEAAVAARRKGLL